MKNSPTTEVLEIVGRRLEESDRPTAQALLSLAIVETFDGEQSHSVPDLGIEVSVDSFGRVTNAHLHSNGHEGFRAFPFEYRNILFNSSREEVRTILGNPRRSGQGRTGAWDLYELEGFCMHFLYASDCASIAMVTVSPGGHKGSGLMG